MPQLHVLCELAVKKMEVSRMHGVKQVILACTTTLWTSGRLSGLESCGCGEIHTCVFAVEEADACSANCEAAGASQGTSAQRRLQVIGMVQQSEFKDTTGCHALPLPDTQHTRIFPDTSQLHTNQQLILGDIFVRTKVWRADERARIDLASVPPPAHSPPL
jgi:hypothetical protein